MPALDDLISLIRLPLTAPPSDGMRLTLERLALAADLEAEQRATRVALAGDHGVSYWIEVVRDLPSRRSVDRWRRKNNWYRSTGCGADCTGREYRRTATLLRALHDAGLASWTGIFLCSSHIDI